jgi:UDP-N-acetylglucosamine acyltransferase
MGTSPLSSTKIHPTAVVDPTVRLGQGVEIGPYCVVTGNVELGDRVKLISHVAVAGPAKTTIGADSILYPFCSIGHISQDLKYAGEPSTLEIGHHTCLREYVTIQPGTAGGIMKTVVGDHCHIMVNAHIAHDCVVGSHVIMSNCATLAGHVTVEDGAIIGGLAAVHQFVRIGKGAMIGGMSGVERDVIPYGSVKGERAFLNGLNIIGLKRRGFTRDEVRVMKDVFEGLFQEAGTLSQRVQDVRDQYGNHPKAKEIIDFVCAESSRSFCLPRGKDDE